MFLKELHTRGIKALAACLLDTLQGQLLPVKNTSLTLLDK